MPLSRGAPSLRNYRDHLRLLALWIHDLARLGVDRPRLDAEAHAIEADLHECARLLGESPAPAREGASLSCEASSAPPARHWGARYVLEGSRLGATFLHRQLAGALAPHSLAYLSGAGWVRDGAWRDFLSQLQQHVATPADVRDACDGAEAAFSLLLRRCEAQATVL